MSPEVSIATEHFEKCCSLLYCKFHCVFSLISGGQDNYVPEDLISLLDAGINAEHPSVIIDADAMFSEDMFGYSQRRSSSSQRYLIWD